MKWWMVRAGDSNELIPQWLAKGKASIGWKELGNPKRFRDRGQPIEESHRVYADSRPGARIQAGSQVWRFTNEIRANRPDCHLCQRYTGVSSWNRNRGTQV